MINEAVLIDELKDEETMNSRREWSYVKLNKVIVWHVYKVCEVGNLLTLGCVRCCCAVCFFVYDHMLLHLVVVGGRYCGGW